MERLFLLAFALGLALFFLQLNVNFFWSVYFAFDIAVIAVILEGACQEHQKERYRSQVDA